MLRGNVSAPAAYTKACGRFEDAAPNAHGLGERAIRKFSPQIGGFDLDLLEPQIMSISGCNRRGMAAGTVFRYLLAQLIRGEISEGGMPWSHATYVIW
jgi:hypothetical protein